MTHTILYFGHLDRNFSALSPGTTKYLDKDLNEKPVDDASGKVDGYYFRFMEGRDKEFFAVGVEDVVLRAPVLLICARHTDDKGFFSPPQFGNDSAMRLLVDMIIANPECRDVLGRLLRHLGPQ